MSYFDIIRNHAQKMNLQINDFSLSCMERIHNELEEERKARDRKKALSQAVRAGTESALREVLSPLRKK